MTNNNNDKITINAYENTITISVEDYKKQCRRIENLQDFMLDAFIRRHLNELEKEAEYRAMLYPLYVLLEQAKKAGIDEDVREKAVMGVRCVMDKLINAMYCGALSDAWNHNIELDGMTPVDYEMMIRNGIHAYDDALTSVEGVERRLTKDEALCVGMPHSDF